MDMALKDLFKAGDLIQWSDQDDFPMSENLGIILSIRQPGAARVRWLVPYTILGGSRTIREDNVDLKHYEVISEIKNV